MMILPALDDERGWRTLLFAATGVTALVYLYLAFFVPGTLTYAPLTIQDDARQFLTWMARLSDTSAMRGDLLADYWQSVGPWAYRMLFTAANMLGLEPLVFARLLPVPLLFLSVWMAWRIALLLTQRPLAAFAAAALLAGGATDGIETAMVGGEEGKQLTGLPVGSGMEHVAQVLSCHGIRDFSGRARRPTSRYAP